MKFGLCLDFNMMKEYFYHCQQMIAYTKDITLFSLFPTDNNILNYVPGQYVEVILTSGDILPLSIANTPSQDGHLEFHIRHDTNHHLAQQFIRAVEKDRKIHLLGPKGNARLARAKNAKKILFVAGGTGFAPINALLEQAISQNIFEIHLYWGVRRPEDAYKEELLKKWQQDNRQFQYEIILSEPEHYPNWQGAVGLVHEYAAKRNPSMQEYCVFASGPYPMIKQAKRLFSKQGLLADHFISDMQII